MHSKQKFTALFLKAFTHKVMNPCLTATVDVVLDTSEQG